MYELLITLCLLFHGLAHCLTFSKYAIYLSVIVYEGTSNCFISTYFMDMLFGFLFTGVSFTVWDFLCRNF